MDRWFHLRIKWLSLDEQLSYHKEDLHHDLSELIQSEHGNIPAMHRPWVWPFLLMKTLKKVRLASPYQTYRHCVREAQRHDASQQVMRRQGLLQDSSRLDTPHRETVVRILTAIQSRQGPEVTIHYTYGMADICVLLLDSHLDEATCFWTLLSITETLLPQFHIPSLGGFHHECEVLTHLLAQLHPTLASHLSSLSFVMSFVATDWLLPLFSRAPFPCDLARDFLDLLFVASHHHHRQRHCASRVYVIAVLSIFTACADTLVTLCDAGDVLRYLVAYGDHLAQSRVTTTAYLATFGKLLAHPALTYDAIALQRAKPGSLPNTSQQKKKKETRVTTCGLHWYSLVLRYTQHVNEQVTRVSRDLWSLNSSCVLTKSQRASLWSTLLSSPMMDCQRRCGGVTYQTYLMDAESYESATHEVINADMPRTVLAPETTTQASIGRILRAYSERNPSVGYCQGMNEITALLLSVLTTETRVFWVLCHLVETMMSSYHVTSLMGLHTDCYVLESLLATTHPTLAAHLTQHHIPLQLLVTKWLMLCFITVLPSSTVLTLLDLMFSTTTHTSLSSPSSKKGAGAAEGGSTLLLTLSLALLLQAAPTLLSLTCMGEMLQCFQHLFTTITSETDGVLHHTLLSKAIALYHQQDLEEIHSLRKTHRTRVASEMAMIELKREERRRGALSKTSGSFETAVSLSKNNTTKNSFSTKTRTRVSKFWKKKKARRSASTGATRQSPSLEDKIDTGTQVLPTHPRSRRSFSAGDLTRDLLPQKK